MQYLTDDVRITGMAEVQAPAELIEELPLAQQQSTLIFNVRREASDIIKGGTVACWSSSARAPSTMRTPPANTLVA